jgi:hypothetical protein
MKQEDYVRCNNCMSIFSERHIIYVQPDLIEEGNREEECPVCHTKGALMDNFRV